MWNKGAGRTRVGQIGLPVLHVRLCQDLGELGADVSVDPHAQHFGGTGLEEPGLRGGRRHGEFVDHAQVLEGGVSSARAISRGHRTHPDETIAI